MEIFNKLRAHNLKTGNQINTLTDYTPELDNLFNTLFYYNSIL